MHKNWEVIGQYVAHRKDTKAWLVVTKRSDVWFGWVAGNYCVGPTNELGHAMSFETMEEAMTMTEAFYIKLLMAEVGVVVGG